jgi:hypothetical protein
VLSELAHEAIKRERLSDEARKAKNVEVASLPIKGFRSRKFASDYAKFRFALRIIDVRWERLRTIHRSDPNAFQRGKETVLQENANAFFGGSITYTPRPAGAWASPPQPRPASLRP